MRTSIKLATLSVALALLRALDCDVQCVTFKNFCFADEESFTDKSCCSLEAIEEARRLARGFGAPHWVGDVEEPFRTHVIDPFIAEYNRARTPNPCLDCNGVVRFPELVRLADRLAARFDVQMVADVEPSPFAPAGNKVGDYTLANRVALAPMAGVTDLPFRRLCTRFGAGARYHAPHPAPDRRLRPHRG